MAEITAQDDERNNMTEKARYERHRVARAIRRDLANINLDNSNRQQQSPFYSMLPAELRFLIFQLVLSQQHDQSRPIDSHSWRPACRPGHTYHIMVDLNVLLTCRIVYFEAQSIPLRSATHHVQAYGSWHNRRDNWLYHITKQRGADLYHLHEYLLSLQTIDMSRFLLPQLKWRRITWTLWTRLSKLQNMDQTFTEAFTALVFPESCQEVTLELEFSDAESTQELQNVLEQLKVCRQIALTKADGTKMKLDNKYSVRYKWTSLSYARWPMIYSEQRPRKIEYNAARFCWRTGVGRREYMSYDYLDCLNLTGSVESHEIWT